MQFHQDWSDFPVVFGFVYPGRTSLIEKGYPVNGCTVGPSGCSFSHFARRTQSMAAYPICCSLWPLRLERLGRETIVNGTLWDFHGTEAYR
jgi:hypothetical protein